MAGNTSYKPLNSLPEDMESPMLAGAEDYQWEAIPNLDAFLARLYRYWQGKGLASQVLSGALNLGALGFTVAFSGFLLLGVDWHGVLTAPCLAQNTCDIISVALSSKPLSSRGIAADIILLTYLVIFGAYWAWSTLHYLHDVKEMMEMRHWVSNKLGVSDSSVSVMTWAELLHKVVKLQSTTRLCMSRDLDEHDMVSRIMRKDNFMIAMINKGVLRLTVPPMGLVTRRLATSAARKGARWVATLAEGVAAACDCAGSGGGVTTSFHSALNNTASYCRAFADGRSRMSSLRRSRMVTSRSPLMTKTLEWNIRWCVLDYMFDDKFSIRKEFLQEPNKLRKRLRTAALVNAILSPFLLLFLLLYFFMRNAERFYHHPGSAGSRRWSAFARWHLREFNELPHYISHRLDAAHGAACHYVAQFPSYTLATVARFASFIAGSFTAILLLLTMLDERLLERPLLGRHLVWWLATLGVVLTASRAFITDAPVAYDPEGAMQEVVVHTHYLPRHWRARAHTPEVQQAFNQLFKYKLLLFLEELASVILTPFILYFSLSECAEDIVKFVSEFTAHVDGVGHVCSLAHFDLKAHGNPKYGAPCPPGGPVRKSARSRQGKLEKSLLTFMATYPTWEPSPAGKAMLMSMYTQQQQQHNFYPQQAGWIGNAVASAPPQFHTSNNRLGASHWQGLPPTVASVAAAGSVLSMHSMIDAKGASPTSAARRGASPFDIHTDGLKTEDGGPKQNTSNTAQLQPAVSLQPWTSLATPEHDLLDLGNAEDLCATHHVAQAPQDLHSKSLEQVDSKQDSKAVSELGMESAQINVAGDGATSQLPHIGDPEAQDDIAVDDSGYWAWPVVATSLQCSVFGVVPLPGLPGIDGHEPQHRAASTGEAVSTSPGTDQREQGINGLHTANQDSVPELSNSGGHTSVHISDSMTHAQQQQQGMGASALLLPPNETHELTRRLVAGHSVLQNLYERSDFTVQHRRMARYGSAVAGSVSGMTGHGVLWGGAAAAVGMGMPGVGHASMFFGVPHVANGLGAGHHSQVLNRAAHDGLRPVSFAHGGGGIQGVVSNGHVPPLTTQFSMGMHQQNGKVSAAPRTQEMHAGMLHHHSHAAANAGGHAGYQSAHADMFGFDM